MMSKFFICFKLFTLSPYTLYIQNYLLIYKKY